MKLWGEFLHGWFNGAAHIVNTASLSFPTVEAGGFTFQQMPIKQPLDGVGINIIGKYGTTRMRRFNNEQTGFNPATFIFDIRATVKAARADGHTGISLCRMAADRLYGILLDNQAMLPLNRAGITLVRPTPPKPLPSTDYVLRTLECKCTLQFPILLTASVEVYPEFTIRAP